MSQSATPVPAPATADSLLFANEIGSLLLDATVPCLLVQWNGFANSRNFRDLMARGLALYQEHAPRFPALGWLSDTRLASAQLPADHAWLVSDWNPPMYAAGLRYTYFVEPESIFGQMNVQQYARNAVSCPDFRLESAFFATVEEAKDALRQALRR